MNMKFMILMQMAALAMCRLSPQRISLVKEDVRFRESEFVLANPDQFFYYLQLSDAKSVYAYHCYNLSQSVSKETNLERIYFGYKALKELKCELDSNVLSGALERSDYRTNFIDLYYGFTFNVLLGAPKQTMAELCEQLGKFTNALNARVKKSLKGRADTLEYGSMALKLLKECAKTLPEFAAKAQSYAISLRNELKTITKSAAAWPSESPVSATIQIATSILYTDRYQLSDEALARILAYLDGNLGPTATLKEQVEWNGLLAALESSKVRIVGVPEVVDLRTCGSACQLRIENLPDNSRAEISANGHTFVTGLSQGGVITLADIDFGGVPSASIQLVSSDLTIYPSAATVGLRHENKISFTRMKTAAFETVTDLMDSDDSECSSIVLSGNESTFLHVGYRTRVHENFSFVFLEPESPQFDRSALVHSVFNERERLYVSVFDFSDFEIIRPNSDTYSIWIVVGDLRKQCGKISLTFMNSRLAVRESIAAPAELPIVKNTYQFPEQPRFYITGLYFLVVSVTLAVSFRIFFSFAFSGIKLKSESRIWGPVFYGSLILFVANLAYLLFISELIETAWLPALEIFLVIATFKKNFYGS